MAIVPPNTRPRSEPDTISLPDRTTISFPLRTNGGTTRAQIRYTFWPESVGVSFVTQPAGPRRKVVWKKPVPVNPDPRTVDKTVHLVPDPGFQGELVIRITMQEINAAGQPIGNARFRSASVRIV